MNANAIATTALPKAPAGPARLRWLAADAWVLARRQFATSARSRRSSSTSPCSR